ncbi:hypothetical protein AAF712_000674 [Marasmius tenuissimus]|uniref:Uncharacterized protein n=1 Tax=Marasmius tenuissimus TaxID=585030 RepID=A0ABR3AEE1_9AGAR
MSFQSFRLGEMAMQQPLPPHLLQLQHHQQHQQHQQASTSSGPLPHVQSQQPYGPGGPHGQDDTTTSLSKITQRAPYGSGDSDDGYTLVFASLDAFHEWRTKEEDSQMVEFVKGDTHGSKAVPPRFKEHTKLVCARHSRSGRKKYVKKHPERVRKVPSRKIEGQGCPASISFKTYFDTEEVRACYISQHSHEIGLANLPFTRRGRKAAAEQKSGTRKQRQQSSDGTPAPPPAALPPPSQSQPSSSFSSAVSMLAPLPAPAPPPPSHYAAVPPPPPGQPFFQHPYPAPYPPQPQPPPAPTVPAVGQDRWQNMETLFHSIREHARTYAYPVASVAALESVLIRLFLESPAQPQSLNVMQAPQHPHQHPPQPQEHAHAQGHPVRQPSHGEEEESGSDESS